MFGQSPTKPFTVQFGKTTKVPVALDVGLVEVHLQPESESDPIGKGELRAVLLDGEQRIRAIKLVTDGPGGVLTVHPVTPNTRILITEFVPITRRGPQLQAKRASKMLNAVPVRSGHQTLKITLAAPSR